MRPCERRDAMASWTYNRPNDGEFLADKNSIESQVVKGKTF